VREIVLRRVARRVAATGRHRLQPSNGVAGEGATPTPHPSRSSARDKEARSAIRYRPPTVLST